jgi:hypothetical protein
MVPGVVPRGEDLGPCPHCGHRDQVVRCDPVTRLWHVECRRCGHWGPRSLSRRVAVETWRGGPDGWDRRG